MSALDAYARKFISEEKAALGAMLDRMGQCSHPRCNEKREASFQARLAEAQAGIARLASLADPDDPERRLPPPRAQEPEPEPAKPRRAALILQRW